MAILGVGTTGFIPGYGLGEAPVASETLLVTAIQSGIRYVDTAAGYADSETILARVLAAAGAGQVEVCTKVVPEPATSTDALQAAARLSLDRLGLEVVDDLLWHSATAEGLRDRLVCRAFAGLKETGLTRRVGASTYGTDAARTALASDWCQVVQVEFSILNQELGDVIAARRAHQRVVVRSVLCKGLLTPRRAHLELPPWLRDRLAEVDSIARAIGMTTAQIATRFAMDVSGADVVLVGAASPEELTEAQTVAAAAPLDAATIRALRALDSGDSDWAHPERWERLVTS